MADYIERDKALTLDFRIEVDLFESRRKTAEPCNNLSKPFKEEGE